MSDPASVKGTFEKINQTFPDAKVAAAVFNLGAFVRKPFLELTLEEFNTGYKSDV